MIVRAAIYLPGHGHFCVDHGTQAAVEHQIPIRWHDGAGERICQVCRELDDPAICVECGNAEALPEHPVCSDCIESWYEESAPASDDSEAA